VRPNPDRPGAWQVAVLIDDIGWIVVDDRPDMLLEYRDEASWKLLPVPMRQASADKGWCRTTPSELIEILQLAGAIE